VLVREGEFVQAGQVLARVDTEPLEAQRRQAQAQLQQAQAAVATTQSQAAQRGSDKGAAQAVVAKHEADRQGAHSLGNLSVHEGRTSSTALAEQGLLSP